MKRQAIKSSSLHRGAREPSAHGSEPAVPLGEQKGAGPGPGLLPVLCVALPSVSWWQRGLVLEGACWLGPGALRLPPPVSRARGCHGRAPTVGLPGPRLGSLPAFFVWPRERGLEGPAPVRCPLHGTVPGIFPRDCQRSWARPTFQERTWSIEGLQNFPEAALGLEAVLTAVHLAGEGAGEPRGGPGCREASDRQATLPSVSSCLSSD